MKNETDLSENSAIWETIAVCDEGERKGGKQIVFAGKKFLLHRLIISYKLEETNIYCF